MLTWALNFVVAYCAVTLASSSWSSHKQTHSMGSELLSADEIHCWKSIQLRASAWLFAAAAPSPLCRSKDPATPSFFSLHCNVQACLRSCQLSGRYFILVVYLFTEGEKSHFSFHVHIGELLHLISLRGFCIRLLPWYQKLSLYFHNLIWYLFISQIYLIGITSAALLL